MPNGKLQRKRAELSLRPSDDDLFETTYRGAKPVRHRH